MSRVLHTLSAPWRLAKAMRRHGVGPVTDFLVLTVRRRGALDSVRLALADRRRREDVAEADLAEAAAREVRGRTLPPDLDPDYSLSAEAWSRWAPWVGAAPPHPDPHEEDFPELPLLFVIQGADAEARRRTEEAVAKLGPVHGLAPSNGRASDPERFHVFLKAGDLLVRELPREIARAARRGVAEVVSFDLIAREDDRVRPLLLPGANPTLLRATDYLFSRVALRGAALGSSADRADPRDLVLRWLEGRDPMQARGRWRHVGRPLVEAAVTPADIEARRSAALEVARAPLAPASRPPVSVVICTKDKGHLTRQLVRGLLTQPEIAVADVVIVSNNTVNPYALQTLADLATEPRVQVLKRDEAFNFSKLANAGARACQGRGPILFLNDDIAPVSEDWLQRLVARLDDPAVGAVGPLLLYPDETLQHAGMYLGYNERAGHTLRGARLPDEDYLFTAVAPREVSCLTGAVLLVRREAFEALNGFDEQLATYLQDVDLGMRLRRSGWLNVFEPASVLIHMESASIRALEARSDFHRQREAEHRRFAERWGEALRTDPYHPAGFDPQDETLRRLSGAGGGRPAMLKDGFPSATGDA